MNKNTKTQKDFFVLHIGSNQSDVLHDFGNYAENTKGISFGLSIQINQKRIHGVRN